jgi:predicted nucleic acid-binding Zn ribbon protein
MTTRIACRECGGAISSDAPACSSCAALLTKAVSDQRMTRIAWGITLALLGVLILALSMLNS